ncbi:oligoribonuclease isoform X1 [Juglans microcarpa x Juglans regia]|uniref:oligoribonuclease isoform X1 n=1 Tax=Juglans microcarpa x Juglans regia TaxID=2249226 RepID=UPI001B7EB171|nr:oligoribonuclease isoform X1 [Juglans microcarpa x Juglans regia]
MQQYLDARLLQTSFIELGDDLSNRKRRNMDSPFNAFSLLELDAEDDKLQPAPASAASGLDVSASTATATATSGKSEEKIIGLDDKLLVENGKCLSNPVTPSVEYKLPLVWIDLEMTGLNVEVDRILEIACIITDGKLTKTLEGPDLVIHQSKENLDRMGEWCQNHHAASGLTKKVLHSTTCEKEAEKQVMEFVKRNVGTYTPLLAGNSIYVDFLFLKKYMPDLAALFSHVLVDVSSVKALCMRWYPRDQKKAPSKENKHRAMDDIRESIMELKYYKENIFKASKSRK